MFRIHRATFLVFTYVFAVNGNDFTLCLVIFNEKAEKVEISKTTIKYIYVLCTIILAYLPLQGYYVASFYSELDVLSIRISRVIIASLF